MNFKEAFEKAFDVEKDRLKKEGINIFSVQPATAKILAFFWNMLAVAQNQLDDFAFIDKNNQIGSIPLTGEPKIAKKEDKTKKSGEKTSKSKQTDAAQVAVNGSNETETDN